jgi:hypothetical protein
VAAGSYGYSTEGAPVDDEGNEIKVWDEEVLDQ